MPTEQATQIRRRRVVQGAAWAVPALVVGATAPAYAASGCAASCPSAQMNLGSPTGTVVRGSGTNSTSTGWQYTSNCTWATSNKVGYYTSGTSTAFGVTAAPTANCSTGFYNPTISLNAACSYTLKFDRTIYYTAGYASPTLSVRVGGDNTPNSGTQVATYTVTDPGSTNQNKNYFAGTQTVTFSGVSGPLYFWITVPAQGGTADNVNDLSLSNLSLSCA
ncbi:hypothetical protein G9U51_07745 [Calidifontibacter sp. DB0510]|uniref:Uncharacterized protein n=1 Tax=Metallococcus carri TaxID=1656884 RepID=A0A967B1H1_9MICO|nr:hypothetical protein [Metallococcus carri]NHN55670.1 hypothetical protein [Metallococcus carri]NOP38146.1 hypothetical protein [Calidifontibacter sp. DB2511S]